MGKSFKTQGPLPPGHIDVADEIVERFGRQQMRLAIQQYRLDGACCWVCRKTLKQHHPASLLVDLGSAGAKFGFICFDHGPSQICDLRRDRRASNEMMDDLEERCDDSIGFASWREYPPPRAMLTVSPRVPIRFAVGENDAVDPWLELWIENGFELVGPPVVDSEPALLQDWIVHVSAFDTVKVTNGALVLFEGQLSLPDQWKEAVVEDSACVVFAAASTVDSNELGDNTGAACEFLASSGQLVGATMKVEAPIAYRGGLIVVRNGATLLH